MRDEYIVIEVPHQIPARATVWRDEAEAIAEFEDRAAKSTGPFDSWVRDNYGENFDPWESHGVLDEIIWAWAEHDLHALHRWDMEEAREMLARLQRPNGGRQKIHQQLEIAAALERFVK